jgi:hypothetical protein
MNQIPVPTTLIEQLSLAKSKNLIKSYSYMMDCGCLYIDYTETTSIETKIRLQQHLETIYNYPTLHSPGYYYLRVDVSSTKL